VPARQCLLADGAELLGEFQGSGRTPAPYLIRRPDGRMLEVSPLLYLVAASLAGAADLDEVAHRVTSAGHRPVSVSSVSYLIDRKLRPLGIVAAEASEQEGRTRQVPVVPALGLAIRCAVLPASMVRGIARLLRPLFLPPAMLAVLLSLAATDGWLIAHHGAGAVGPEALFDPASLLIVVGLTLSAGMFHELGHATACHYGGARPGVIGVGIYLLWPVFYNDLNDSYRLPRRARLRADLGGVYFNAVFIVGLAGAYWVTGLAPLLLAILVQHVAIAQQFLPFVRLDGYYVVSDMAGVPDLFGRIRPTIAALARGRRPAGALADLAPRARAVVIGWMIATIPLLGGLTALLVLKLPAVLGAGWESLRLQAAMVVGAQSRGDTAAVLLHAVQAVVLAIPFAGLAGVTLRIIKGRRQTTASPPEQARLPVATEGSLAISRSLLVGASLLLVVAYLDSRSRGRRRWSFRR
jgi:putative peptide zinc metalloprotease protein